MIEFKNIKENAYKAYEKGELFEFLMGYKGYELKVIDAPVDVPTDWTRIISNGVYEIFRDTLDEGVKKEFEEALIRAISGTCEEIWEAANILYFQMDHEKMGKAPFCISEVIAQSAKKKIMEKRTQMEQFYPYGKNGWNMYEDILRLNQNFKNDWGYGYLSK